MAWSIAPKRPTRSLHRASPAPGRPAPGGLQHCRCCCSLRAQLFFAPVHSTSSHPFILFCATAYPPHLPPPVRGLLALQPQVLQALARLTRTGPSARSLQLAAGIILRCLAASPTCTAGKRGQWGDGPCLTWVDNHPECSRGCAWCVACAAAKCSRVG